MKLTAKQQFAIDLAVAEQYGRMAHEAGHARVPAFDADHNALRRTYDAGISFGWPGHWSCSEAQVHEGDVEDGSSRSGISLYVERWVFHWRGNLAATNRDQIGASQGVALVWIGHGWTVTRRVFSAT